MSSSGVGRCLPRSVIWRHSAAPRGDHAALEPWSGAFVKEALRAAQDYFREDPEFVLRELSKMASAIAGARRTGGKAHWL
eukprot:5142432-Alexandrium_andersonii.AAC.1